MRYIPVSEKNIKSKIKLLKASLAKSDREIPLTKIQNDFARSLGYSGWAALLNAKSPHAEKNTQMTLDNFVICCTNFSKLLNVPYILSHALFLRIGLYPSLNEVDKAHNVLLEHYPESKIVLKDQPGDQFTLDFLLSNDLAFERFMELLHKPRLDEMNSIFSFMKVSGDIQYQKSRYYLAVTGDMYYFVKTILQIYTKDPETDNMNLTLDNDFSALEVAQNLPKTGFISICGPTGHGLTTASLRLMHALSRTRKVSTSSALMYNPELIKNTTKADVYNLSETKSCTAILGMKYILEMAQKSLVIVDGPFTALNQFNIRMVPNMFNANEVTDDDLKSINFQSYAVKTMDDNYHHIRDRWRDLVRTD